MDAVLTTGEFPVSAQRVMTDALRALVALKGGALGGRLRRAAPGAQRG